MKKLTIHCKKNLQNSCIFFSKPFRNGKTPMLTRDFLVPYTEKEFFQPIVKILRWVVSQLLCPSETALLPEPGKDIWLFCQWLTAVQHLRCTQNNRAGHSWWISSSKTEYVQGSTFCPPWVSCRDFKKNRVVFKIYKDDSAHGIFVHVMNLCTTV